jgi:hypothetical protein
MMTFNPHLNKRWSVAPLRFKPVGHGVAAKGVKRTDRS